MMDSNTVMTEASVAGAIRERIDSD